MLEFPHLLTRDGEMEFIEILAGLIFFFFAMGFRPEFKKKALFMVYHSDSQKIFHSYTLQDALEWLNATYDDAILFDAKTGQTLKIVHRRLSSKNFTI